MDGFTTGTPICNPVLDVEERAKRRAFGRRAHEIEGNPLDAEDIALFESFDREGLTDEERRAVLARQARLLAAR